MRKSILLASGSTLAIVAASTIATPAFACSSSSACLSGLRSNGFQSINYSSSTNNVHYAADVSGIKYTSDQSWVNFPVSGSVHLTTNQGSINIDPNHVCLVGPNGSAEFTPGSTTIQSPAGTNCAASTSSKSGTTDTNNGTTGTNNSANNTTTSAPQSNNSKITTSNVVTPAVSVSSKDQATAPAQTAATVLPATGAGNLIIPAAVASVLAYAGNMLRLKRRVASQN